MVNFIFHVFYHNVKKKKNQGFPGGSVVKNLPANAEDTGSIPHLGTCHMPVERLSPSATTTEPAFQSLCSATREACTAEQPPLTATREKPAQQQRLSTVKNKCFLKSFIFKPYLIDFEILNLLKNNCLQN